MKVTLSAAMRARDVSRPRPEDEEAAQRTDQAAAAGPSRDRGGRGERSERSERSDRADRGERSGASGGKSGGGRRRRRR
jgi:hypothetical protein